jgi:hypothetical protein
MNCTSRPRPFSGAPGDGDVVAQPLFAPRFATVTSEYHSAAAVHEAAFNAEVLGLSSAIACCGASNGPTVSRAYFPSDASRRKR